MESTKFDSIIMEKIVWYYYFEDLTQSEIADLLGITRARVIKLLNIAKKTGVIQFKLKKGSNKRINLYKQLIDTFKLKDVLLIPEVPKEKDLNTSIAQAAAMYINDIIPQDGIINIGYGDTPSKVLNHLATMAQKPISCVSLTGGVSYYLPDTKSGIFNAKLYLMPFPLLCASKEMASAMQNESAFTDIVRMISLSSVSVVGIGAMNESATVIKSGILSLKDLNFLKMKGAVGDVLCHFIDKNGDIVENSIEESLIAISLGMLKQMQNVIAVAGGEKKVQAIYSALVGGYFDILITDEKTAEHLITLDELNNKTSKEGFI
ncbi:MAG: sugar-binding transcriptional regulator [Christensenellales bacterium]|jgi:lsr operon transcriptional repressor